MGMARTVQSRPKATRRAPCPCLEAPLVGRPAYHNNTLTSKRPPSVLPASPLLSSPSAIRFNLNPIKLCRSPHGSPLPEHKVQALPLG